MEGDRKYKQHGYQDTGRESSDFSGPRRDDRPKPQGPRLPIDVTGPRLPRMVQAVTATRCHNCTTAISSDIDFQATCPKCNASLHCCKQCAHFEPSTRFQCLKPVPVRIAAKDHANNCTLFKARVTVARDAVVPPAHSGNGVMPPQNAPQPRSAEDARAAFDNLFKK